jgi:hypothetical protein
LVNVRKTLTASHQDELLTWRKLGRLSKINRKGGKIFHVLAVYGDELLKSLSRERIDNFHIIFSVQQLDLEFKNQSLGPKSPHESLLDFIFGHEPIYQYLKKKTLSCV